MIKIFPPGNIQIHSSNPTTNTIQGPNVVLYGGALYYNCYNQLSVCRFNLTSKAITVTNLPKGTRLGSPTLAVFLLNKTGNMVFSCSLLCVVGLTRKVTSAGLMNATRIPIWTWPQMNLVFGWLTPPAKTLVTWFYPKWKRVNHRSLTKPGTPPFTSRQWPTPSWLVVSFMRLVMSILAQRRSFTPLTLQRERRTSTLASSWAKCLLTSSSWTTVQWTRCCMPTATPRWCLIGFCLRTTTHWMPDPKR